MVGLKLAHPAWGPRKIRELYLRQKGQAALLSECCNASGLTQVRRRRQASESGRLCTGRKAQAANEVWTVDFKGWWWRGHYRCEPLTVRDEYSRYLLELHAVPDARTETLQRSFERLFERHGLPGAIRSDNGSPFASRSAVYGLSRLSAWRVALGIDLERGRPGHPQDNGLMKDCTATFGSNSKALDREPARMRWIFGARHLTSSAPMRPWACAAPASFTTARVENIRAPSRSSFTPGWPIGESTAMGK